MAQDVLVAPDVLEDFVRDVFTHLGLPIWQAEDAASVLVWSNLRGVDTHGVRNLGPSYARAIEQGRVRADAECAIEHETPFSARVDGAGVLGMAAGVWAMRLAIEKARQTGIGLVAMRNSRHYGAAGYYPAMALPHDMIGVSMTGRFMPQGEPIGIVPTFAAVPMFSTNPIALAVPTLFEPPYILDMATSITPYNRVKLYEELGMPLPLGWGLDDNGQPTNDPMRLNRLLPLGGSREMGSHKGYGLAMLVTIFTSVLSACWTTDSDDDGPSHDGHSQSGEGHFFGAIRIDAFRPPQEFKRSMDAMIRSLHSAPKEPGQERIYVAGEIEYETELRRRELGIPLAPNVQIALSELAERFGLGRPF